MNTSLRSERVARRAKAGGIQCSGGLQKLAHAVWQCKYHIIWCPKCRFRILRGALQKSVGEILHQLCEWKKLEVLEMNVQEDHVHVVLSIPPKFSVSEVVGFFKGKCAIKIFDKHLELKKRYWGRHFCCLILKRLKI